MFIAMPIFDTHKYISQLKAAGVPESQAEVHSAAFVSFGETVFDRFPTKDDLKQAKDDLKQELRLVSTELNGRMDRLEERMHGLEGRMHGELMLNRWMLGTVVTGVLALLVKNFS